MPANKKDKKGYDLKRVNIRVSEEVYQYFRRKSDTTGISASAMMFLALEEYVRRMSAK